MASRKWRDYMVEKLREHPEEIPGYLNTALEENDGTFFTALKTVVDAKLGGAAALSRETGLHRVSLQNMLTGKGNPRFENLQKVMNALGLSLSIPQIKKALKATRKNERENQETIRKIFLPITDEKPNTPGGFTQRKKAHRNTVILKQENFTYKDIPFLILHRKIPGARECVAVPRNVSGNFHHMDRIVASEEISDTVAFGFIKKFGREILDDELTDGVKESLKWWFEAMERKGLNPKMVTE